MSSPPSPPPSFPYKSVFPFSLSLILTSPPLLLSLSFYLSTLLLLLSLHAYTSSETTLLSSPNLSDSTIHCFLGYTILTLLITSLHHPLISQTISTPLTTLSTSTLLTYFSTRPRPWLSNLNSSLITIKLNQIIGTLTTPLNRLAWLIPLSSRSFGLLITCLTINSHSIYIIGLIVFTQIIEINRTKTHSKIRLEANLKLRKWEELKNLELNKINESLNRSPSYSSKYIARITSYNKKIKDIKNPTYWRLSVEGLFFSVLQRLIIIYYLSSNLNDLTVKEKFACLIILEKFVKSSREVVTHFIVHLPRESEQFSQGVIECFEGVDAKPLHLSVINDLLLNYKFEIKLTCEIRREEFCLRTEDLILNTEGIYCLKGDNGCGKSTFLKLLTGEIYDDDINKVTYECYIGDKVYEENVFESIYEGNLISSLTQSTDNISDLTYGDYFLRLNSFCSPCDVGYYFEEFNKSDALKTREWFRIVVEYFIDLVYMRGTKIKKPKDFSKLLSNDLRDKLKTKVSEEPPRFIFLDEPDKEIDQKSVSKLLGNLWKSVGNKSLKMMITHTEINEVEGFEGNDSEAFTIQDFNTRIGIKSGGERQRLRLAEFFFRVVVRQAVYWEEREDEDEDGDDEEEVEIKILNVEKRKGESFITEGS